MARALNDLRVRVQLQHPKEGDLLAWTIQAELLAKPAWADVFSFEKEMAELESAES